MIMTFDVYISYSWEDNMIAEKICSELEAGGIRCWIAPRDVLPGMNFTNEIVNAIDNSSIMVVVFSSHSNESPHVTREITR
jgi:hypothetical protein